MPDLIYEDRTLFRSISIWQEGDCLIFSRKNIAGEKRTEINILDITRIEARKELTSYTLMIYRDNSSFLPVDNLTGKAIEELQKNLGSLIRVTEAREKISVTIDEIRNEAEKVITNLAENFDARIIVSFLVSSAVKLDCSDIHITPARKKVRIQFRKDGLLTDVGCIPVDIYPKILAALKNMAKLASYKRSVPQDGSFRLEDNKLDVDIRCATMPTLYGEKVVLRILNTKKTPLFLEDLGFDHATLKKYQLLISQPQGCIVLTGPAGSGKTTTIFASLISFFNAYQGTINIATIEDPVEYVIEEFQQTQIKEEAGMTFAAGLKSLLRLDPDIIMAGEIRDGETAQAAVRAALTGHLLFTTLHARNTLGVYPRLIEMGITPQLAASAITAVLYQRLIRKLCPKCKKESQPPEELLKEINQRKLSFEKYYSHTGCPVCGGTGYSGRTGIFELLAVDENFREMLIRGAPLGELTQYQVATGMKFLRDDAMQKILSGITDFDEIQRVCPI